MINKENLRLKNELKNSNLQLEKINIVTQENTDKIQAKDAQINLLNDEIVKISNLVNEERLADFQELRKKTQKLEKELKNYEEMFEFKKNQNQLYEVKIKDLIINNVQLKEAMLVVQQKYLQQAQVLELTKESNHNYEQKLSVFQPEGDIENSNEGLNKYQEVLEQKEYYKDLTDKLKERLERVMGDLEFYRQKLRQLSN